MSSSALLSDQVFPTENRHRSEISLEIPIETPECVEMTYRVAGPASRLGAYLLDTALRFGILFAAAIILSCAGVLSYGLSGGLFLVIWFVVEWFYFAISEAMFNGRTLGKRVMGIRTIQAYGYPVTWWSANPSSVGADGP